MSTRGVVDLVFCIDASASMQPCIDAVRHNAIEFVKGLSGPNSRMDWRIDFVAHACDEGGLRHRAQSTRKASCDLWHEMYRAAPSPALFTNDLAAFQQALGTVVIEGDEAPLIGLDTALDFPWRPRSKCHRVIVFLTDEPFETGVAKAEGLTHLPAMLDKIQRLGVALFMVAPPSEVFDRLSEVDRSEYQVVDGVGDGLRSVRFDKILGYIGKSLSVASLQGGTEHAVPRALFGQDTWVPSAGNLRGK